jgi:hypothetical protein
MSNFRMALVDLLRKDEQVTDPQFLRDGVGLLAQELMEAEALSPRHGVRFLSILRTLLRLLSGGAQLVLCT